MASPSVVNLKLLCVASSPNLPDPMRISDADILFVPGLGNSGPDHWQTRWEQKLSTGRRVEQDNWERPSLEQWTRRIPGGVARSAGVGRPGGLLAPSLGARSVRPC